MKEGQVKQDCDQIGARQGETGARHSRDRGETGARQRETGARQGRDSARHSRDRGETGARQERDMTEDENMDIYFFYFCRKYFLKYFNVIFKLISKIYIIENPCAKRIKPLGSRFFFQASSVSVLWSSHSALSVESTGGSEELSKHTFRSGAGPGTP